VAKRQSVNARTLSTRYPATKLAATEKTTRGRKRREVSKAGTCCVRCIRRVAKKATVLNMAQVRKVERQTAVKEGLSQRVLGIRAGREWETWVCCQ